MTGTTREDEASTSATDPNALEVFRRAVDRAERGRRWGWPMLLIVLMLMGGAAVWTRTGITMLATIASAAKPSPGSMMSSPATVKSSPPPAAPALALAPPATASAPTVDTQENTEE